MFVLNFVGYVLLVVLFWLAVRRFADWRRWVDIAFVVYVGVSFLAWLDMGRPNPMNLGYLSKAIEIALLLVLLLHVSRLFAQPRLRAQS